MKNRLIPMLLLLLATTLAAKANPVDMRTAREVAVKFLNANTKTPLRGAEDLQLVTTYRTESDDAAFHIFNTPNGFVIVSADDCATPILGYSDEGRPFDLENIPIQLQDLFNCYMEQFQYGFDNHLEATEAVTQQWRQVKATGRLNNDRDGDFVEPLLTTHWEQGWPFNAMCPLDNNGDRSLAGCLPVAVGQIMKYHNWPPKGSGYVRYTTSSVPDTIYAVFDTTYYDWENMPEEWTDSGYESMAQLLSDIGKSTFADFSGSSTGAYENMIPSSLADVFNYDYFSMQCIMRNGEDDDTWFALIKNELDNDRPVYYGGWNSEPPASSGHAWVCDGYDANQMCHFNFGWGGLCDGYYALSQIINPFYFNYNYQQRIIIGIQPSTGNTLSGNDTLSGSLSFDKSLYCGAFSNVTIMPGTELKFAPGKGMCVTGSLLADGTEENPILITAIDTAMGWGGLQIHPSMICYKMVEEPDTLSLNYTTISYASNDGIHLEWPNYFIYPTTPDNVIHKGLILYHSKIAHNNGKGIAGERALLKIDSCEISNNGDWGIHFDICGLDIRNSSIHHNRGAINQRNQSELFDRPSSISNNSIFQNTYGFNVNEVCIIEAGCDIIGNHIFGNYPLENDGTLSARAVIRGGRIVGNSIHDNDCNDDNVLVLAGPIIGNKIYNNTGKAIMSFVNGTEIINNLIYNNEVGIYYTYANTPTYIFNNTIVNNNIGIDYGYWGDGVVYLNNNIIWNNGEEEVNVYHGQLTAHNNNVRGGSYNIIGNNLDNIIVNTCDKEPKFVNPTTFVGPGEIPEGTDFSLAIASPAIDNAYLDTTMVLPAIDLAGNPRIKRLLDIGAYENQSDTIYPCFLSSGYTIYRCTGRSMDLSFLYRGEGCTFSWFHNDAILDNLNSDTLHIDSATLEDVGDYYCVISNEIGNDTSQIIHVFVSDLCEKVVNIIVTPTGSGLVTGAGMYELGDTCTISATAFEGHTFSCWIENEEVVSTNAQFSFIVNSDRELKAVFSPFTVTVIANPEEWGTVSGSGTYDYGTIVPLVATPNEGYFCISWTKNGEEFWWGDWISLTVTESNTYIANFAPNFCNVDVSAYPSIGGVVTGGGTYEYNATAILAAIPNEGYTFVNWTKDNEVVSTEATISLTVTEGATYVANFIEDGIIAFADENVKNICVEHWDTNDDGELSYAEAAVVTTLNNAFSWNGEITSFNELQYFFNLTVINEYEFSLCGSLTSIVIPNAVTIIGEDAFWGCGSLPSIVIPSSVVSIGSSFFDCPSLMQIVVDSDNPVYDSRNNCNSIIETATNTLVVGCAGTVIPNTVVSIGDYAFKRCNSLISIEIPNSVGNIGDCAFIYCGNLTYVIVQGETPPTLGWWAFEGVDHSIPVYVPCGSLAAYQHAEGWNEFTNIIEQCPFHFTTAGTWSTASNWQGDALPGINDLVFIDAPCQLDQNAEVAALTVSEGQSLTLQSGKTLTVTGNMTNTEATGLVIEDSAQLVHNVANVQATVRKAISPFSGTSDGWHLIALPLTGSIEVDSVGHLLEDEYDLYGYDEPTTYWMNSKHPGDGFTALEAAKGYLYANGAEVTLEFSGTLVNSSNTVSVPLSYTDEAVLSGFNLVGNPFPCDAYLDRQYYVLSANGKDVNPEPVSASTPIPPCTAVFVKAEAEGETVVFIRVAQ